MIAIAHVIKNKGATAGLSMVESALKTVTTKKGKTVKWFYGAHSDLAKKYLDKLKHISMGAKGAGDKARKSRASVLDAVFNPVDPVGGATMFEGNVFLGPNRKEGSVFQEIYVDTGIAYDPVTFGETTFFKERCPSAAKKWRQENNIK